MPNSKKIKTASNKKTSGTKLDKFQPMVLEMSCCVYTIFSNGPCRPSWIVNLHTLEIVPFKKSKRLHTRNILAQSWISFNQWFLRYCHFRVYDIIVTFLGGHLELSVCINMERFHSGTTVVKSGQNTFMFS